jgi:hypothetical protein
MKTPRYVEVPLVNGDTARVGAWSVSTPGLLITEVPHWYGYENHPRGKPVSGYADRSISGPTQ